MRFRHVCKVAKSSTLPYLRLDPAIVATHAGTSAHAIFGDPDDIKFRSSMTLFARAAPDQAIFSDCLRLFFGGVPDPATLAILQA